MDLNPSCEQIQGGFVISRLRGGKNGSRGFSCCFMVGGQGFYHIIRGGKSGFLLHFGQGGKLGVRAGGRKSQGVDSFRNAVHSKGQLRVLLFKHQVQSAKPGAGDIPVVVVGFEIQCVTVRRKPRKPSGDIL